MTTLTLTNVSHDLASLEMSGRLVYIERRHGGRLRVFTFAGAAEAVEAGGLRTVGLVGEIGNRTAVAWRIPGPWWTCYKEARA